MINHNEQLDQIAEKVHKGLVAFLVDILEARNLCNGDRLLEERVLSLIESKGSLHRAKLVTLGVFASGNAVAEDKIVKTGIAIEAFQLFALTHDDIIDDDEYRRGKLTLAASLRRDDGRPTNNSNWYALLIGDLIHNSIPELIESTPGMPAAQKRIVVNGFHTMGIEVVKGQLLELSLIDGVIESTIENLIDMAHLKSGRYSLYWPFVFGLLISGIDIGGSRWQWVEPYFELSGIAFQTANDLQSLNKNLSEKGFICTDDIRGIPTLAGALLSEMVNYSDLSQYLDERFGKQPKDFGELQLENVGYQVVDELQLRARSVISNLPSDIKASLNAFSELAISKF